MSDVAVVEDKPNGKKSKAVAQRADAPVVSASGDAAMAWLQTIERLAPSIGIEGVRELMKMRREEQASLAEREFNAAMAEAQAALVPVAKNRKNDQTRSTYADMAAIADAAMPIVYAHGFGVITSEFESKKPDHLGVACEVTHKSGHSKRYEFNIPWDGAGLKGNANKTATHAYGSTLQYGERYAKCKVFGIATKDDDGNTGSKAARETIAEEQEKELRALMEKANVEAQIVLERFGVKELSELTIDDHKIAMSRCKKKLELM